MEPNQADMHEDVAVDFATVHQQDIVKQIEDLANTYADALDKQTKARITEMEHDDKSHYLIYQVLRVTEQEGHLIDVYQNKGRFLYKYAGSFLEAASILCFLHRHKNAIPKQKVNNTLGTRPKEFEIDCLIGNDAIELANARLDNPQKTLSRLLEVGKEAYFNQDDKTRTILDAINALVVQRNNGLDGFLKTHYHGTPVAIRVQRQNETLEEARKQLLRASATKNCILKILIRTTPYSSTTMFDLEDTDTNLLTIDSHDVTISQWLQALQEQATTMLA